METLDGPVLVLAGAGTGKTRVLTTRIAHILAWAARPSEILAVTFTNKAAREMKERVGAMVGQAVEGMPWLGTFHAIGVKILRRHAELVGLKTDFTILDIDDQIRLLKQLLAAENIDEKRWPARVLAGLIDGWKNRGLTPTRCRRAKARPSPAGGAKALRRLSGAAEDAQRRRLRRPAAGCIRLFREQPDVLRQYQRASGTSWWTSIRTPTSRSICGCGCWRSGQAARSRVHAAPSPLPLRERSTRAAASGEG